ncbi:sporulation-delaying protein SdpB family protein [Chryseobacterium gleum]|uniref:sporulation-delaying protein SdpB family protein n=1 Tax=Chryseobacterium gleum TaxID=250 RepID=UPI0028A5C1C6|nr:sporulation-delaying protein SdpB family protein [Chryseobacterium gleum]
MSKLNTIENKLRVLAFRNSPYTNVVGLSRSLIALGTLLTLLVNPVDTLFVRKISGSFIIPPLQNEFANKINFFYLLGNQDLALMKWFAIIILTIVISGYLQKITCLLHWWISFSFLHTAAVIDGGDQIATILTLLLIPICVLDNRKNHWSAKIEEYRVTNLISICFMYIIRLQVAIIYFHASVGKFAHPEWANGTAIYYWLHHSNFGMPDYFYFLNPFLGNSFFVTGLTYGVLILELLLFLALFASKRYRLSILIVALIFHLFIILFHGIFSFFFSISAALILYLYPTNKNFELKWSQKK